MAQQIINIGTTANDGTGDSGRTGGDKVNDNFTEVYHQAGMPWDPLRTYSLNDFSKVGNVVYVYVNATPASNIDPTTDADYSHWKPSNFDGNITNYATSAVSVTVANPVGRNISVLDYTAATGTITLPSGANMTVGGRVLIKKRNATMGSVNINKAGTDAVQWGTAQLRLYSDGDYWLLMWDGSRWCLLNGYETGSNANGDYVKYANGTLVCRLTSDASLTTVASGQIYSGTTTSWIFPSAFIIEPFVGITTKASTVWGSVNSGGISLTAATARTFSTGALTDVLVSIARIAIGRWA